MQIPSFLHSGDIIDLAASARKVLPTEMAEATDFLNQYFTVNYNSNLFEFYGPFAGNDQHRSHSIQQAINDPFSKAILFVRGGYGSVRIIDELNFDSFASHAKWVCGFSDVTVFHAHLNAHNIASIHSCMPITMQGNLKDEASMLSLVNCLKGNANEIYFDIHHLNRNSSIKAEIIGGNLSVLYSLIGSKSEPDYSNKILFIEDIGEYVYHIDRMMWAMKRAGKFNHLKACVVGSMSDMNDNNPPFEFAKTAYEIIAENLADFNFPVYFGFPAGHEKRNLAFYLGVETELKITNNKVLFTQQLER